MAARRVFIGFPASRRSCAPQPLAANCAGEEPERLIGDRAYDSDPLDEALAERGIEMISPHRRNRKKPKTQDGRKLRRYKWRWKLERLFAWLGSFRRLVVRYERRVENYLGLVRLGCIVILLSIYEMDSTNQKVAASVYKPLRE